MLKKHENLTFGRIFNLVAQILSEFLYEHCILHHMKQLRESFVCLLAVWQTSDANPTKHLKGLQIFSEDKSEPFKIIVIRRHWDKISGREYHLMVIRRR